MGLLNSLFGMQAQAPGSMQQPTGLGRLLAPEVALPLAAGLLGNGSNAQNFAQGLAFASPGLAEQKQLQAQTADKNKTLDFFRANAPEYAQMIQGGMPVGEAWQTYTKQKFAKPERNEFAERAAAAEQYGLTGDDATSFALTGQLPTGRFGAGEVGLQPIPVLDDKGNVRLYQPTKAGPPVEMQFPEGYRPMSPFDKSNQTAFGRGIGEAAAGAATAIPGAMQTAARVNEQVEALKNHSSLGRVLGPIDSRTPAILPGSVDAQSKIDQLRGGAFLEARQMLKGGGAITDFESQKAEQAYARLNQGLGEKEFRDALDEFNFYVQQGIQKLQAQAAMGDNGQQAPRGGAVDYNSKYGLEPRP